MKEENNKVIYYADHRFEAFPNKHETKTRVINSDTFTFAASCNEKVACLNFASHKRPGGGYETVLNRKGPIRTQEEDLFRRSDLPAIMDNNHIRKYYPLENLAGLYCECTVTKDRILDLITPFETAVITVPAVVNPDTDEKLYLARSKAKLILNIAADQGHEVLVLGAWGCGVFNNEPQDVAEYFKALSDGQFKGVFREIVFAIPTGEPGTVAGRSAPNYKIFESVFKE